MQLCRASFVCSSSNDDDDGVQSVTSMLDTHSLKTKYRSSSRMIGDESLHVAVVAMLERAVHRKTSKGIRQERREEGIQKEATAVRTER